MYSVKIKKEVTFWTSEGHETKEATFTFNCPDRKSALVLIGVMAGTCEDDIDFTVRREPDYE